MLNPSPHQRFFDSIHIFLFQCSGKKKKKDATIFKVKIRVRRWRRRRWMMARWQGVEELGSGLFEGGEGDGEEVDGVGSEGGASVRQRAARKAVGDER
ncbi:uncharacterized protein A4U43_C07F18500 [Asparagus officinalis]|uniref:Uncharacterized protein n=1 Tax=Asparagus officinalis TaxID=4686 RepID=A0A5P1ECZ7_ASPOF|nr:uncharacterized protein A4U43_C07F18500 [Asparagus officinalis]